MENRQKLNDSHNLLLNLFVRECNSWYFFDIVPKYDEYLAFYMQSCSDSTFIRFDLKQEHKTLYLPIHYKSLSGMHIFSNEIGIRNDKFGKVSTLDQREALLLLAQEYFPELTLIDIDAISNNLTGIYNNLVQTQVFNLIPEFRSILAIPTEENTKDHCINNFAHEYSTKEKLNAMLQLVSVYAQNSKTDNSNAATKWLKHYTNCLLDLTIKAYVEEGKIIVPNLLNTRLETDENGQPKKLYSSNQEIICSKSELPEQFNFEKIEHFLQTQLLTHHLFPIARALSLLGLNTEEDLLESVSKSIIAFWQQYPNHENFIMNHTIYVDSFLPSVFSRQNSDYFYGRIHRHNHLINTQYYSDHLIHPQKGSLVHKRYFENSTMEIGIRAFDITTDLEVLYEWVNKDYAKKFWEMDGPIEELEEAYIKHLGVDYSHPYIGTLNGEPIFTLELYWAIKDEVGKYYPFHPGDYGFHMLIAPANKKIKNFSYYALTMCMEYFFSHTQVHRMIGEASVEHAGTHNLITKVGCEFNKALRLPYKTSNLTFLSREMYKEAVQDVLDNSCTEIYLKV